MLPITEICLKCRDFPASAVVKISSFNEERASLIPVQFSSVSQSCPTVCEPMDCSTPGFPVYPQLLEVAQTHVHRVSHAIQWSHPLLFPSHLENPLTVWKGKKIGHWKMNSPGWQVPNVLLEISGELTPERMKRWSQRVGHDLAIEQ